MDIANYIGLFLLKNHFCYVHGFGNIELKKRPASFDGKALQSPVYEVVITQGGSIDDNLANFIATNEQISISKAANALRDYSIQARKDLAAGKEVPLPNIGKFVEQNGKIDFVTDANFRYAPAGIPTIRNSKQLEEQNAKASHKPAYPPPANPNPVNWSMVILAVVLLVVIGGGAYGIYYYTSHKANNAATVMKDTVVKAQPVAAPPVADTMQMRKDSTQAAAAAPAAMDSTKVNTYKMIVGAYPNAKRAETRQRNLQKIGTNVEIVRRDSATYCVIATINCRATDTLHVEDSLGVFFGYKGVMTVNKITRQRKTRLSAAMHIRL